MWLSLGWLIVDRKYVLRRLKAENVRLADEVVYVDQTVSVEQIFRALSSSCQIQCLQMHPPLFS